MTAVDSTVTMASRHWFLDLDTEMLALTCGGLLMTHDGRDVRRYRFRLASRELCAEHRLCRGYLAGLEAFVGQGALRELP